ncbi:MAG: selenocysteine-specific translation elongation factor [Chloroflexi bacterium]|nr:selenocysteine-specific translation elongation factor [Chloroflexota bacterium]
MYVVGTAGHVDHGKSTLVYRLTGIDPDRLAEEKRRGMTIDLGFAWLTLPSGAKVSLVDVPGHERFIKNMLAGVGSIDAVLLVVAADEGVMPQTREHLAIVDLLGITRGVVAITKCDLVDDDWLELVREQLREVLAPTGLHDAPLVPVSSVTDTGINDLVLALEAVLLSVRVRNTSGVPRLPIDRVFTLSGHGTIVAGTLTDGVLAVGEEVELLPPGVLSRIRSLQTHRQKVERAAAGARVAVNLAGVTVDQVHRGDVLTLPGSFYPTKTIDATLHLLPDADHTLRSGDGLFLYLAAAEVLVSVRLLDARSLGAGQSGIAQLRLMEPIVTQRDDRFILRRPSPGGTIGGGTVLDAHPPRVIRGRPATLLAPELEGTQLAGALLQGSRLWSVRELAERLQLSQDSIRVSLSKLADTNAAVRLEEWAIGVEGWDILCERVRGIVGSFHERFPLRTGIPREELRTRLGLELAAWSAVERALVAQSVIVLVGPAAHLPSFQPVLNEHDRVRTQQILHQLGQGGMVPPSLVDVLEDERESDLISFLMERGEIVKLSDTLALTTTVYRKSVRSVIEALQRGPVTVAQVRDLLGTNRRSALALLDHLDGQRVTRREQDTRALVRIPDWYLEMPRVE